MIREWGYAAVVQLGAFGLVVCGAILGNRESGSGIFIEFVISGRAHSSQVSPQSFACDERGGAL